MTASPSDPADEVGGDQLVPHEPVQLGPSRTWAMQRANNDVMRNVESALARDLPGLDNRNLSGKPFIFVGGGPSLRKTWPAIDLLRKQEGKGLTVASNDTHEFLRDNGVKFDACVISEIMAKEMRLFDNVQKHVTYYVASQAHPSTFDKLAAAGARIRLWHMAHSDIPGLHALIGRERGHEPIIGGGTSGALRFLTLAVGLWKTRHLHIFGLDSSIADQSHAYEHRQYRTFKVQVAGREFEVNRFLYRQAETGMKNLRMLPGETEIQFYGDGLLPHWFQSWMAKAQRGADDITQPVSSDNVQAFNPA